MRISDWSSDVCSSDLCTANGCSATGTAADVAAGIRWAADRGADVINLSLGGRALQATLGCAFCDAVEYAWSKGPIPVIAAGNDSVLAARFADAPPPILPPTTPAHTPNRNSAAHGTNTPHRV